MIDATLKAHWNAPGVWPIQVILDYVIVDGHDKNKSFKDVIEQHLENNFGWEPFYDYHFSPDENNSFYYSLPITLYNDTLQVKMELPTRDHLMLLKLKYA
jgi:hypothetical protein